MPLHPEQHPLTQPDQEALDALLRSAGMVILKRVCEARANLVLCKAVQSAYDSRQGDALVQNAQTQIAEAHKYRDCLEVLAELTKQQTHFEVRVSTVKPQPPTT